MKRKTRSKGFVSIHVRQINGLDKYNGSTVYIDWYRGSRSKHSGHTKFALVREGIAIFDERIEFSTTFFQDISGAYDEKLLALAVVEATTSKKSAVLLKAKVNLMNYLPTDLTGTLSVGIPLGSGGSGALMDAVVDSRLFEGGLDGDDDFSVTVDSVSTTALDASSANDVTAGGGGGGGVPYVSVSESQALIDSLRKEINLLKSDNQAQKQALAELEIAYEKLKDDVSAQAQSSSASSGSAHPRSSGSSSSLTLAKAAGGSSAAAEAHVLRSQKKTTTHKRRMTVAPGGGSGLAASAEVITTTAGGGPHKSRHGSTSAGKRGGRLSVTVGGAPGSLASLLSTAAGAGADGATEVEEREFAFVSSEIFGCPMKVVGGVPVTAQTLLDRLQETNALGGSAEAKERLAQVREALHGALAAAAGNVRRMAYWLAVGAHAVRLAAGILADDKIPKDERALQHETAMGLFEDLAGKAYQAVVAYVVEKIRPNFAHTILDTQQNGEMMASFPGTPPRPRGNGGGYNGGNGGFNGGNGGGVPQGLKKGGPSINLVDELFAVPFSGMVGAMTESGVPQKALLQVVEHLCRALCAETFNRIVDGGKAMCSVQMGFQVKLQLSKIRDVLYGLNIREAYTAFAPLEEAAILMITDASMFVDVGILKDMCPSLSLAQARAILTLLPKAPQTFLFRTRTMVSKDDSTRIPDPPVASSVIVD